MYSLRIYGQSFIVLPRLTLTMKSVDAEELITKAKSESDRKLRDATDALDWFIERQGKFYNRKEAASSIAEHLDISEDRARQAIAQLVGDLVDPVQQIMVDSNKKVGIIEYRVWEASGCYGYVEFHDLHGDRKRVICGKCVEDAIHDSEVSHATEDQGSIEGSALWDDLVETVESHIEMEHSEKPENIEPGASLVSGTTISSNTAWHAGNDGDGSGLAADNVDGYDIQKNGTDGQGIINFKT